ncbi:MAG TPA: pyridoxamine 5'-phosphate oxidase [Blastocatellia bacterium]|nr:pyridoxamine 5'-phosphate oxidase [Blastocatellia bacterium]
MTKTFEQLAQMRREYLSQPLHDRSVNPDPITQFKSWFEETLQIEQPDPEAMTLSTVSAEGEISARIVLLKGVDERGFIFFTNYESRKSRDLIANPRAALTFYWSSLNRQVNIRGTVEMLPRQPADDYFQTRPRGSQLGAWASPQSREVGDRQTLERMYAEAEERFGDRPIPCPPFWGGFLIRPITIEFWQGRENRLHDRILYRFQDGAWRISRLAP